MTHHVEQVCNDMRWGWIRREGTRRYEVGAFATVRATQAGLARVTGHDGVEELVDDDGLHAALMRAEDRLASIRAACRS